MIYAPLSLHALYAPLLPSLSEAFQFLLHASPDMPVGRYPLSGGNYANVDQYLTLHTNPAGYEAHRKYVDLQFLLRGEEDVLVHSTEGMKCTSPYSPSRDVAFFQHTSPSATLRLGQGQFLILFPHDAHEPQHCLSAPMEAKKVVVKIAIQ